MIPNTVHLLLDCGPPQAGLAGLESRRHGVHLLGGELGGVGGHVVAHGHRPLPKVTIECYISSHILIKYTLISRVLQSISSNMKVVISCSLFFR